ncbi:MAG: hypothetical protein ACI3ZY_05785 [Parabacteroides sp.]
MTEDQNRLLAVFEVRVRDLMALCDIQRQKIVELTDALNQREEALQQTREEATAWRAKFDNLLTAKVVSANEEEMKDARMRLSKLVREVDRCIALLNE